MEIHVYLTGRLGNQLFQYALARSLQKKYGGKIYCNVYELEHISEKMKHVPGKFKYDMKNYILDSNVEIEDKKLPWYVDIHNPIIRIFKKAFPQQFFQYALKKGFLIWQKRGYKEIPDLSGYEKICLIGWWQDIRYFENVEKELAHEIVPTTTPALENKEIYAVAQDPESVCISIRGGNYLVPKVKKSLFVCDREYFYEAVRTMKSILKSPKFIVFSDDLEWVKSYIGLEAVFPECTFYYEKGTDTIEEKIRMMTSCHHFIISNSSFSWWAQYLCTNENKIVIAPSIWNTSGQKNGLYMNSWKLIDVEKMENQL